MSGKTDALIIPAFLLLLPAAAVVGTARVAGSVLAAIQKEYREAKEAQIEKERCEEERREAVGRERRAQAERLSKLVGHTGIQGDALSLEIDAPEKRTSQVETAGPASDPAVSRQVTAKPLPDRIRTMREEVHQGFPDEDAWAATRKELLAKLEDLERLAKSSPSVASQGVSVLETRIERELKECAASLEARSAHGGPDAPESSLLADMRAKLSVVGAHPELPDLVERANALAKRLERLSSGQYGARQLAELEKPIDALISELCVRTAGEETGAIVKSHVKDVLLSLGYQVTETPPPSPAASAMVTSVAPGIGVEFSVGYGGRMKTEVVSLSDRVSSAGPGTEESACALVDRVYRALGERRLTIREGFRLPLQTGDRLRKVTLAGAEDVHEDNADLKNLRHAGESQ